MVIEEILVHNFGVFRGEQKALLAPPSSAKPIVLFGGLNGAGKTTLLEAMQLVLYGRNAVNGRKPEFGYEEYLRRLIHRHVNPKDGAAVQVMLRVNEDGETRVLRVRRTWAPVSSRIIEKLEVFRDGELDQHLTDTWLDYVGRLIPPQLSGLFFFDGERIESLADPSQSLEILQSAIHALLGVDLVRQLQADLLVLNRRKIIDRRPDPEREKLAEIEKTAQALQGKLQDLKQSRAQLQGDLDYAVKRVGELNEKFAREGGLLAEDRLGIEQRQTDLQGEKAQIELELRAATAGCLPLALLKPMLFEMRVQATAEGEARQAAIARSLAEERDRRLLQRMRKEIANAQVVRQVGMLLDNDRETHLKLRKCSAYLHMDDDSRRQLEGLCDQGLAAAVESAASLIKKAQHIGRMIDGTERKLATIPDAEAISRLVIERDAAKGRHDELESGLKRLDADLASLSRELELQERELAKLSEEGRQADLGNEEADRFIRHADLARETLERFRVALTEKHADRLSQNILTAFGQLLRKQHLVHRLRIDPGSCRLTLEDFEGKDVPSERLSAGERQLLAVSILWGLGQAAGRSLPVIVDTPLGRLDTNHRMHLVQRYFPNASHQVILLSTDEEIADEYLEALRPKIGRCYRLVHDDAARCTKIEPGYFEKEAV